MLVFGALKPLKASWNSPQCPKIIDELYTIKLMLSSYGNGKDNNIRHCGPSFSSVNTNGYFEKYMSIAA